MRRSEKGPNGPIVGRLLAVLKTSNGGRVVARLTIGKMGVVFWGAGAG